MSDDTVYEGCYVAEWQSHAHLMATLDEPEGADQEGAVRNAVFATYDAALAAIRANPDVAGIRAWILGPFKDAPNGWKYKVSDIQCS